MLTFLFIAFYAVLIMAFKIFMMSESSSHKQLFKSMKKHEWGMEWYIIFQMETTHYNFVKNRSRVKTFFAYL